jgi:hypothetical protein
MSTPEDPEELFDQMVPQLSQQLTDRLLNVASEYLACMASLEALSASSDDPAVQSVIDAAAAVRAGVDEQTYAGTRTFTIVVEATPVFTG